MFANEREGRAMDYKEKIIELLNQVSDGNVLELIYEILKRLQD